MLIIIINLILLYIINKIIIINIYQIEKIYKINNKTIINK
jgi:hypothetical protein